MRPQAGNQDRPRVALHACMLLVVLMGPAATSLVAETPFDIADIAMRSGDWKNALQRYGELAQSSDASTAFQARVRQGKLLVLMGRAAEAVAALQAAVPEGSNSDLVFERDAFLARAKIQQGWNVPIEESLVELAMSAQSEDQRAVADLVKAEAFRGRGHLLQAQQVCDQILSNADPLSDDVAGEVRAFNLKVLVEGWALERADQAMQAIDAVRNNSRMADELYGAALLEKGNRYLWSRQWGGAKSSFQEARNLVHNRPDLALAAESLLATTYLVESQGDRGTGAVPENQDYLQRAAVGHYLAAIAVGRSARLADGKLDHARIKLSSVWRDRGMTMEAVGFARLGIADTAMLTSSDKELSRFIGATAPPDLALGWAEYLLDTAKPDPFQPIIREVMPEWSAFASDGATPNHEAERHLEMGFVRERRFEYEDAMQAYAAAAATARTAAESAEAFMRQSHRLYRNGRIAEAEVLGDSAASQWLQAIQEAEDIDAARTAVVGAADVYNVLEQSEKVIAVLDQLLTRYSADHVPVAAAYAANFRALRDTLHHPADAEARLQALLAAQLERPFKDELDSHRAICAEALARCAAYAHRRGDEAQSEALLDQLTERWPGQYEQVVSDYRAAFGRGAE